MKKNVIFLLLTVMLLCLTGVSCAASAVTLWVSPDGQETTQAIEWYKSGKSYYLFIPGNVQTEDLKIGYAGADSISLNGETIEQQASAAVLTPGETYEVKAGKKKYSLIVMQGSGNLPAVYITTESGKMDYVEKKKGNKESGSVVVVSAEGETEYDGAMQSIKMRGNSSITFAKKNYQIKLEDGADLCGMGKSKTWVLTANYRDKSLLRNQITFDMAMYAGMAYTPEHISADVYINHEYMGLYLFGEKVSIDGSRIDIADLEEETQALNDKALSEYELSGSKKAIEGKFKAYGIPVNPEDITGGYLIEYESYSIRYKQEASAYYTKKGKTLVVKSPEYCSVEQMTYISSFMQSFENAIFADDGNDPDTGKHFSELVDMNSLVCKYLIEEISKNYDGNSSSMFFYKPADSVSEVAFAGPVWDYDSSYGSYAAKHNANKVLSPKGLWIGADDFDHSWWPALYQQSDFYAAMTKKYKEVFVPAMEILLGQRTDESGVLHSLDEYMESIRASSDMNLIRWPRLKNSTTVAQTGYSLDENVEFLKNFISERMEYLSGLWLEGN